MPAAPDAAPRELVAVREIVQALLTAERPDDVFRFALERVGPIVGATFASVYLIDSSSELMRLVAAYNWPPRHARWLGEVRVRVGFGPSGEAASERRAIEVPDVFADPLLEDWQEVATELGFRALIALPLQTAHRVLGAVTFYFNDASALGGEQRGLMRIVAAQMAVTAERAALLEELKVAQRVREEFLTNVTHELRTPLTAVMGYISLLQEEYGGPLTERQRADLELAKDAGDRLLGLIEDLLELTALANGSIGVFPEPFDPREPIREAINRCPSRSDGTRLEVEEPIGPVACMCTDRAKLTKILINLLDNAYKFTGDGVITISLCVVKNRAIYQVRDTGIGVPAASQAIVFEDFRQLDGSLTRRYGGTGMGLALSRRLAHVLGGTIDLVSTPDEGSTFTLDIPLEFGAG